MHIRQTLRKGGGDSATHRLHAPRTQGSRARDNTELPRAPFPPSLSPAAPTFAEEEETGRILTESASLAINHSRAWTTAAGLLLPGCSRRQGLLTSPKRPSPMNEEGGGPLKDRARALNSSTLLTRLCEVTANETESKKRKRTL